MLFPELGPWHISPTDLVMLRSVGYPPLHVGPVVSACLRSTRVPVTTVHPGKEMETVAVRSAHVQGKDGMTRPLAHGILHCATLASVRGW